MIILIRATHLLASNQPVSWDDYSTVPCQGPAICAVEPNVYASVVDENVDEDDGDYDDEQVDLKNSTMTCQGPAVCGFLDDHGLDDQYESSILVFLSV